MGPLLDSIVPASEDLVMKRQQIHQIIKDNLCKAQERMKRYADLHRSEREFQAGDLVYLKLQPYRQSSIALRKNLKLNSKYYGPYRILAKIGPVAYKLELPSTSRVHPVFHVSLLKKKIGAKKVVQPTLPSTGDDGQFLLKPVAVLQRQIVKHNNAACVKLVIQWSNLPQKMPRGKIIISSRPSFQILLLILEGKYVLERKELS